MEREVRVRPRSEEDVELHVDNMNMVMNNDSKSRKS
jgi:hypothetical protein